MRFFLVFLLALFAIYMVLGSRNKKILLMIFSFWTFTLVHLPLGAYGSTAILLPLLYFVSELKTIRNIRTQSFGTPIFIFLFVVGISLIISIIHSPHYHTAKSVIRLVSSEYISTYLLVFFAYYAFDGNLDSLKKTIGISVAILLIAGVINLALGFNPFINIAFSGESLTGAWSDLGSKFTGAARFRTTSLFMSPFDYGFISIISIIVSIYLKISNVISSKQLIYISLACLFGIIFCNCRTIIICTALALLSFVLIRFRLSKGLRYLLISLFAFGVSYAFVPFVANLADSALSIFLNSDSSDGSSMEMRSIQWFTVLSYIKDNQLFGLGTDFFLIDLGYINGALEDKRLMGLESVILKLLLEHGYVGLILYVLSFSILLFFFIKRRRQYPDEASAAISVIITYLSFAVMTGELGSLAPTMLILGVLIKMMQLSIDNNAQSCSTL